MFYKSSLYQPDSKLGSIDVFTKSSFVEHLVKSIFGKRRASLLKKWKSISSSAARARIDNELHELQLEQDRYDQTNDEERAKEVLHIIDNYRQSVSPKTFDALKYNSIYIDEGQDFYPCDMEWINKLIKKPASTTKKSSWKLWIFGDNIQSLYSFKNKEDKTLLHIAIENGECMYLKKIVRSPDTIYNAYHPFVDQILDEEEASNDCATSDSEDDSSMGCEDVASEHDVCAPSSTDLPCVKCNCIPPRVPGRDIISHYLKKGEDLAKLVASSLITLLDLRDEHTMSDCALLDGRLQLASELDSFKRALKRELLQQGKCINIRKFNLDIINSEDFAKGPKKLLGKRKCDAKTSIQKNRLVVDTIRKFKGLESKNVFLILKEGIEDEYKNLTYVGMSRAISQLYVFYC